MSRSSKKKKGFKIKKNSLLGKLILVVVLLIIVLNILRYAAYFKKEDTSIIRIIIQNEADIELKHDIYIGEYDIVYLSEDDIKENFDKDLHFEEIEGNKRVYYSLPQNKILRISEDEHAIYVNNTRYDILGSLVKRDGVYYFPISELESVYNIDVNYIPENKRVNIEKLSEEKRVATVNRDIKLKYKMTNISRTVDNLEQGEKVTILKEMDKKWVKVKTDDYKVGYVKKSKLVEFRNERKKLDISSEYFSGFNVEKDIIIDADESIYENFNERISTYEGRTEICKKLSNMMINKIVETQLDDKYIGIKIRKVNVENKENYYRFLEALRVYANSNGCFLIVEKPDNIEEKELRQITDIVL